MTLPTEIEIEVNSDLKAIDRVLFQFNNLYHNTILQQDWLKCQLALVEGFTNAVRHAHKNLPIETPITIAIAVDFDKIVIRIWDYGEFFDLENFIINISRKDRNWLGSGRGIAIMNKIADTLNYNRVSPQQNCLVMVKYFRNESVSRQV